MYAELIFTGTELLSGQVLNTHGQFLGQELSALGIEVILHTTVGDDWERMAEVFRQALRRSDIIITTGGLGPTADDLTKETVADVLGLPMVVHEPSLEAIREHFARRGMAMPESIRKQACFPAGAKILPNPKGTAPGALLETDGRVVIILPGPPWELQPMFRNSVAPYLARLAGRGAVSRSRVLKLTGIAESVVQDKIRDLTREENPRISFLVQPGEVQVRITARAEEEQEAERLVTECTEKVRQRLAGFIFGVDEENLEEVVGQLLADLGATIAVAESCTGGLLSTRLTNVPGSSRYMLGGVVAYDNRLKEQLLGVPREVLEHQGAVSEETAVAMAQGVRRLLGADFGLAVTGIAGPTGGTPEKPVGLVYIALSAPDGTCCREFRFPGQRHAVRQGSTNAALNLVRLFLMGKSQL
jgi:nicotinamide-nucleotide amidase